MIQVDILGDSKFPVNRKAIRLKIADLLRSRGVEDRVVVSVLVVGDRKMKQLNQRYLKREGTTDVLSFPLEDAASGGRFISAPGEPLELGDVVVSFPQAVKQAAEKDSLVDEEINRLVEHGVLHLLGEHYNNQ